MKAINVVDVLQAYAFREVPTVAALRSRGELPRSGPLTLYRLKAGGVVDVCEVADAAVVEWHRLPDAVRVAAKGEVPGV